MTEDTGKVLGLDWGSKRIGIALSDSRRKLAISSDTYHRSKIEDDIEYINGVIYEQGVGLLVVGMPINMDGTRGEIAEQVSEFIEELSKTVTVPIKTIDERLTSAEAERVLLDSDVRRRERKQHRDKLAATLILQRYLDSEEI